MTSYRPPPYVRPQSPPGFNPMRDYPRMDFERHPPNTNLGCGELVLIVLAAFVALQIVIALCR
jgi:hypothetical protein